jgi:hypothetical protein
LKQFSGLVLRLFACVASMSSEQNPPCAITLRVNGPLAHWVGEQSARYSISYAALTKIALTEKFERERRSREVTA